MIDTHFDVAVVGDWHLAFVTATCLAQAGNRTVLVNPFGMWSEFPSCPVYEPGLPDLIEAMRNQGLLNFKNKVDGDWSADVVWMAVDTPVNDNDEPQVGPLFEIAKTVKTKTRSPRIFVVSSQIPIGFCHELESIFGPQVAYVPENLRLGQGIETFAQADRTVIGASTPALADSIKNLMRGFKTQFLTCDLPTSEMVKHATNAFLATSISFANEMARIGFHFGVDSYTVARALKLDARIGSNAYVAPGLGFAGGTLPRDLRVLQSVGKENGIPTPLVSAVLDINQSTADLVAEAVLQNLGAEKRVLILGYTYKADTDTLRRSLSLDIARVLNTRGVACQGFDPFMNGKDLQGVNGLIQHHADLEDIPTCSVVLLMTPRPAFREMNWSLLAKNAAALVIDTQGFLQADNIKRAGLRYRPMWAPETQG